MSKLLILLLTLLISAHVGARDFQMVCPCEVELKSDSLAQVSFSLARIYDETSIDSIDIHLRGNDEQFAIVGSRNIGSVTVNDLPTINDVKSYELLLPIKFFSDSVTYTEIHLYPRENGEYRAPYHYRVLLDTIEPSDDFGRSYTGGMAFTERPRYTVSGSSVEVAVPPLLNLSESIINRLEVILGQGNGSTIRHLKAYEIGELTSGDSSASLAFTADLREDWANEGLDILQLLVFTRGEDGEVETLHVIDSLFQISSPSVALENVYSSNAPQIFSDKNNNGLADYNEQLLGLPSELTTEIPPWEINVAALVTENAKAGTSSARARIEHLFAHTNNIFELSGVSVKLVLSGYAEVGSDDGALISGGEVDQLDLLREFKSPFEQAQLFYEDNESDVIMSFAESDDEDSACGVASGGASRDQNTFNGKTASLRDKFNFFIVGINCPDSVLAHEFGHIAGLAHSRAQKEMGIRGYALGHGIPSEFVTIMPYNDSYGNAPEVQLFSNPNLSQCGDSQPCGQDRTNLFTGADAVYTLNQTVPHIAAIKNGYPPTLILSGESTVSLAIGRSFNEAGYRATDAEDGDITSSVMVSGSVDTETVGSYRLIYSVVDSDTNRVSAVRTVVILPDLDGDGVPDSEDDDRDGDGYINVGDLFPDDPTEWYDSDADGIGDSDDEDYNPASEREFLLTNQMNACDTPLDDDVVQWEINGALSSVVPAGAALRTRLPIGEHVVRVYRNFLLVKTYVINIDSNANYRGWGCRGGETSYQDILDTFVISEDSDGDFISDSDDAFPDNRTESVDTDGDGIGNNSDTDDDGDGVPDSNDEFPLDASESLDTDGDGIGNNTDTDDDGDGVADIDDAFPLDAAETLDTDGDGIGNNADTDDDGDGYSDLHELEMGSDPLDSYDMPRSGGLSPALLRVISQDLVKGSDED